MKLGLKVDEKLTAIWSRSVVNYGFDFVRPWVNTIDESTPSPPLRVYSQNTFVTDGYYS